MAALPSSIRRHPRIWVGVGILLAALGAFALYWFEPQALFIDEEVNEAIPEVVQEEATDTGAASDEGDGVERAAPARPQTLSRGNFGKLGGYEVEGTARVLAVSERDRIVRFENFSVSNGPDLKVYLSSAPPRVTDEAAYAQDFVNLGQLKGNVGNQNYEIPTDVDVSEYRSVVIWCERFAVGFAVAPVDA